jgi:hypothetical protein
MDQALITAAVEQAVRGIKSQELLFALAVLLISMAMMIFGSKLFISMTNKRDEALKELVNEVKAVSSATARVAELQNIDLQATAHNRDLLQNIEGHLTRIDACLIAIKSDISNQAIEYRQKTRS